MKMKLVLSSVIVVLIAVTLMSFQKNTKKEPWSDKQLMAPSELAARLNNNQTEHLVVYNIGPSGKIKNSAMIGATQEAENLALLKRKLGQLSKNTEVVIYCGCCPFNNCPNIRPAFELLNEMNFANAKLLNLPKNLKVDWIDKGYPMQN